MESKNNWYCIAQYSGYHLIKRYLNMVVANLLSFIITFKCITLRSLNNYGIPLPISKKYKKY